MNIKIIFVGKTDNSVLKSLTNEYLGRLKHYIKVETVVIPDLKNTKNISELIQKEKEGVALLKLIKTSDLLVLFDENGVSMTSVEYAGFFQKKMNAGTRQLVMVVGGPYGFSKEVYARANQKISLSKMTFSHQMVRLFVMEQIYRAMTILKNEPYHHK